MDYFISLPASPTNFEPEPGSFLYYCYRKTSKQTQKSLMIIEHFQHHLIKTVELYHEKLVAIKKLEWWIEETNHAFSSQANHPTLKSLIEMKAQYNIQQNDLVSLLNGKTKIISGIQINDLQALNQYTIEQYHFFEALKAKVLLNVQTLPDHIIKWIEQSLLIMEKVRYIYLLPHHKANQIYLLPNINSFTQPEQQKNELNKYYNSLLESSKHIIKQLPSKKLIPLAKRLKLHIKLIKAIKKNQFNVDNERIELTPLQMLFTTK